MEYLRGTGVALVTPFQKNGTLDTLGLARVVEHCIAGNVDYLVVMGTTGEAATLTAPERKLAIDTVVRANANRLPLVLGIGGNNTAAVVEEIKTTDLSSFCAILSVSPYYNKPTQEGIYQHFKLLAQSSPVPIIMYNVPSRTGSNMLPETVIRLARECENIVAVKEASGNLVQSMQIIAKKPARFMVLSGDDVLALPTVLAGGDGVISVLAQGFPMEFSNMMRLGLEGRCQEAFDYHYRLQDAMGFIFEEGNPAGIKAVLEFLELISDTVRLPLVAASPDVQAKVKLFIESLYATATGV